MSFFSDLFARRRAQVDVTSLPIEGRAPEFTGIDAWLNAAPLTMASLRGKVVLVDFWTYSCVNCVRTLPYLRAWHEAYKDKGLVIIGVHTPEFDFERDLGNVKDAVTRFGISYPVATDNGYAMWNAYKNRYWPAHYFIDANGDIRYQHFGEGGYEHSEAVIRALLEEAGAGSGERTAAGVAAASDLAKVGTPETYLGYDRMEHLGSPESVRLDAAQRYSTAKDFAKNIFYFDGLWKVGAEQSVPEEAGAKIIFRFHASMAHLVLDGDGEPHRVRVTLDGAPLTERLCGKDVALADGESVLTVKEGRMYDLVDTRGDYRDHLLTLEFMDPGVKCYAFTFG